MGSGVEASIQVKTSYGLTDGEIAKMLKDSFQYAGDDKVARVLREQQVDARRLIEAVQSALEVDGDRLLDAEERMVIEASSAMFIWCVSNKSVKRSIRCGESLTSTFTALMAWLGFARVDGLTAPVVLIALTIGVASPFLTSFILSIATWTKVWPPASFLTNSYTPAGQ